MNIYPEHLRVLGARHDWVEWLYDAQKQVGQDYQATLDLLARNDNHEFALWLVKTIGPDRDGGTITSVPADAVHVFAAKALKLEDALSIPGNIYCADRLAALGHVAANRIYCAGTCEVVGNVSAALDIEVARSLFAGGSVRAQGSIVVHGVLQAKAEVFCGGSLTVGSKLQAKQLNVEQDLVCRESVYIAASDLEVGGDVFVDGNLHVNRRVYAAKSIRVRGFLDAQGDIVAERGIYVGCGISAGGQIKHGEDWACFAGLEAQATSWDKLAVVSAAKRPEKLFGGVWQEAQR